MTSKYKEIIDLLHRQIVWSKTTPIPGRDHAVWGMDDYGLVLRFADYGDRDSAFGWEIDHTTPRALGGSDEYSNLRPLHHRTNSKLGGMIGGLLGLGAKASKNDVPAGLTGLLAARYEPPRNAPPTQLSGLLGLGAELTQKRAPGGRFGLGVDRV